MLGCLERVTGPDPVNTVIWLHGLGADAGDFWPIVPELDLPSAPGWRFVLPNAPVRPVTINGGMPMRAWFDLQSRDSVHPVDSAGMAESCRLLEELIEREEGRGVSRERIVLAGFSQGGTIALRTALLAGKPVAGVLALSTYLPPLAPLGFGAAAAGLRCFLAHGRFDEVLPLRLGLQMREQLQKAGCRVEWREYAMGHQVCGQELLDVSSFLRAISGADDGSELDR